MLVILLPPLESPVLVKDTELAPLPIFKPSEVNTLFPVVTLVKLGVWLKSKVTVSPVLLAVKLGLLETTFCTAVSALARLALAVVDKSAVYVVVRPLVTAFTLTSEEPCTTDFSALTVYSVAPVAASVALETVVFAPCFTTVLAAAAAFLTSPILAALLSVVPPLATLVIGLLPALMPALVMLGPPVMATPSSFIVVLPVCRLPAVPKLMFCASFRRKVLLLLSATTPILLSVSVPVAPPLTLSVLPSLRSTVVPLSPSNFSGLAA